MNPGMLIPLILSVTFVFNLQAQTANDYVAQGRTYLTQSNLLAANNCFSNALVRSPEHSAANVFYAFTRLLVLPESRPGSDFLSRLGIPVAGRSIYHWTAFIPEDTNGVPLAPTGVNANEAVALLRTNILYEIIGAEANLARITDTNFTLTVIREETGTVDVTLDYGDIRLLRALLQGAEYFCYTTYSWNLDAQLAALRSLYTSNLFSLERLLAEYPNLLTFATTADLNQARTAFENMAERYAEASGFIRNRSTDAVRLFNYDFGSAKQEDQFRRTLADLKHSLTGAVGLAVHPDYMVSLSAHFAGQGSPRSFLPVFRENGFGLATLPDPSFGGLISGLSTDTVDQFLAQWLFPVPTLSSGLKWPGSGISFPIHVAVGRGYVLQWSADLLHWQDHSAFFAFEPTYVFTEPGALVLARRFYRVVDRTENMPPPPNDYFSNSTPVSGLGIVVTGYNANASTEPDEQGPYGGTVWWSWTAPASVPVIVSTIGSTVYPFVQIYTGASPGSLELIAYGDTPFFASAGTTYHIQVGSWGEGGGIKLTITDAATLSVQSPQDGAILEAPANLLISATASYAYGTLKQLMAEVDGWQVATTTNSSFSVTLTNITPGSHYIHIRATDSLGITTFSNVRVTVRPQNDSFARSIPIPGSGGTVPGSNVGASKESGEPNHAGYYGGASVWWSWTCPASGPVTISVTSQSGAYYYPFYPLLAVYTGADFNLTDVASHTWENTGFPAQVSFNAVAGTTYHIAVDEQWGYEGDFTLRVIRTASPTVVLLSPAQGERMVVPANITLTAAASDLDGTISQVDFYYQPPYGRLTLLGTSVLPPYSLIWSNASLGSCRLWARVTDNAGASGYSVPVDVTVALPPPPNDNFADRIPLVGREVAARGANVRASMEFNEPDHARPLGGFGGFSVWWTWTSPSNGTVTMSASMTSPYGYSVPVLAVYTGGVLETLSLVSSATPDSYDGPAQVVFNATAGTEYQIAVDIYDGNLGDIDLRILPTAPPSISIVAPTEGQSFGSAGPANISLLATASDPDGTVRSVEFYHDWIAPETRIATVTNAPYSAIWSNVSYGAYTVLAKATDNSGASSYSVPVTFSITVPPPLNDNFTNRTSPRGAFEYSVGNNAGATAEPNEPYHAGNSPGKSVWWTWTAPVSGFWMVSVSSTDMYYPVLAVYTGSTLLNLVEVGSTTGEDFFAYLDFEMVTGKTYHIVVDDLVGIGGDYRLYLGHP